MEKNTKAGSDAGHKFRGYKQLLPLMYLTFIMIFLLMDTAAAQQRKNLKGSVTDDQQNPLS